MQWPRTFSPGSWRTMPDCPRGAGGGHAGTRPSFTQVPSCIAPNKAFLNLYSYMHMFVCVFPSRRYLYLKDEEPLASPTLK
jgi:hypothetical protein